MRSNNTTLGKDHRSEQSSDSHKMVDRKDGGAGLAFRLDMVCSRPLERATAGRLAFVGNRISGSITDKYAGRQS